MDYICTYADVCVYQIGKFITAATEGTKNAATSAARSLDLLESITNMVLLCIYNSYRLYSVDFGSRPRYLK